MRITGLWQRGDDGVTRPMVEVSVAGRAAQPCAAWFLVDTGADRSAFRADFFEELDLPTIEPLPGEGLEGIGGSCSYALVHTTIYLATVKGTTVHIHGDFAAFLDLASCDMNVLGRDVLQFFDVIVSQRRNEVILLGGNHAYRVEP